MDEKKRKEVQAILDAAERDIDVQGQASRRRSKRKKEKYKPKDFESYPIILKRAYDVSANIYESMILSPAWLDLTPKQKELYQVCKLQMYAQKRRPKLEEIDGADVRTTAFYMNRHLWMTKYQIYKPGNEKAFYRDMEALIDHGFIKCVSSGAYNKEKSIYDYSDKWRFYGENCFSIPAEHKTPAMNKKERKKTKGDTE